VNPMRMKRNIHRVAAMLLALLLLMTSIPVALAAKNSGSCGENLQWTLTNGKLTISGNGAMDNYNQWDLPPWYEMREKINCVQVQSGVTTIGNSAFYNCANLEAVTLPDTVTKIGDYAFHQCPQMAQIRLGTGVQSIGVSAFEGCTVLSAVQLPESLKELKERAFYRCEALGGVTIPAATTKLGQMVFGYCYRLAYVRIHAPITVLPYWFFYGCLSLTVVYLPQSVEEVQDNALSECPKLDAVHFNGSTKVKEQIVAELEKPVTLGDDQPNREVTYQETENSTVIITDTYYEMDEEGNIPPVDTQINATVSNNEGWQEVVEQIEEVLKNTEDKTPTVNIEVQSDAQVNGEALQGLAGKDVTVNIHTNESSNWQINMEHQTQEGLQQQQNVSVSITPCTPTDGQKETLGDADSYLLTLGQTNWNATVLVPVGSDAARDVASLYRVEENQSLNLIQSVIVDDAGKAAFSLAGTAAGNYLLALNVQKVSKEEVRVPPSLYEEYGIDPETALAGMDGRFYTITGQPTAMGIDMGQMTWIVVGALVVTMVAIGAVMYMLNKRKLQRGYIPSLDDDDE